LILTSRMPGKTWEWDHKIVLAWSYPFLSYNVKLFIRFFISKLRVSKYKLIKSKIKWM
jgi:hypothetical protein